MPSLASVSFRRRLVQLGLPALAWVWLISLDSPAALGQGVQAPAAQYFAVLPAFNDGQYRNALAAFQTMQQGAFKNPLVGNWIDSICYFTMQGECYYNLGQYPLALANYEAALNLYVGYSNWMLQVMFPPLPGVSTPASVTPWHTRPMPCGAFSPTYNIQQGRINNNAQIMQGGVVQPAVMVPVYASEIVRCTCLAIRRRAEILGPACPYWPLTGKVLQALAQRPAAPNHWSMAWVEAPLGMAYAAAGKPQQAQRVLEQAVLAGGQVDHPLTPMVLLELGKLALAQGDLPAAQAYFLDASAVGVTFDNNVIEEALRYGALTHMLTNNGQNIYAPLPLALNWATATADTVMHQLTVSLLVSTAEHQCVLRQPQLAQASLGTALVQMAHTDLAGSRLGMRYSYVQALAAYQLGQVEAGDAARLTALGFQMAGGSIWLHQMGQVDLLWASETLSPRQALELFKYVLRDPTPMDWNMDALESLASLVVPHPLFYEHWFQAALRQKQDELAVEIADLLRRHRFLASTELGGRLLNLRWLLEGPEEMLDQRAVNQRNDLRARFPQYEQFSQRARLLRAELRNKPLVSDDKDEQVELSKKFEELAAVSLEQEKVIREISMRREPVAMVFPPLRSTKRVKELLPQGSVLLAYIYLEQTQELHAFLIGKSKYDHWSINRSRAKQFNKNLVSMLQKWGNFEANKELTLEDLENEAWKKPAADLLKDLTKEGRIDLVGQFDELVIVPDDVLWYIPFEALQYSEGDEKKPLISKLRIRYAPTVGLSLADPRPQRHEGKTAVVVGRMFPREEDTVSAEAFDELSRVVPRAEAVRGKVLPAPSNVYASLFDELVVFSELPPADGPYAWAPMYLDRGKFGSSLEQWLALPWGGPERVVLPGYRTSAERAFKNAAGSTAYNELFLSICGLMATGTRTVLISRWRTGGQTSYNLVREFVQELPDMLPAEAWQRAVQIVTDQQLNPNQEPRLKLKGKDEPPKASNPFFWAGYLLVDTGGPTDIAPDEEPAAPQMLAVQPNAGAAMPAAPAAPAAAGDKAGGNAAGKGRRRPAQQPPDGDDQNKPGDKSPFDEPVGAQGMDDGPPDGNGAGQGGSSKKRTRAKTDRKKPAPRAKKTRPAKPSDESGFDN